MIGRPKRLPWVTMATTVALAVLGYFMAGVASAFALGLILPVIWTVGILRLACRMWKDGVR